MVTSIAAHQPREAASERVHDGVPLQLFEFLMVLMSIIVGLGIAALLTGVADLLRARRVTVVYWVHAMLVMIIFLALAQVWWESWSLRTAPEWTFVGLLMMLASPTRNRRVHGFLAPMLLVVLFLDIVLINRILGSG